MAFSLTWLPDVLKAAGLDVIEQPGWQTRGHGDVGTIKAVLCHHTAGAKDGNAPSLDIVTNGRPDLAGPLAQLMLARDGTYFVIAAGKAWHAGVGLWHGVQDGNGQMIGIEAENTGLANDNPWPPGQMDAYARGVAAILNHIGAAPIMCAGHLEYALPAGRKPDPSFSIGTRNQRIAAMVAFRTAVAAAMGQPAPAADDHVPSGTEDTQWLQHSLNELDADPQLVVDGNLGPATEQALRDFQGDKGLPLTGIADAATLAAIHEDLGHHEGCNCGSEAA
jgi:N-acetyl-anhydromuramyl-L-alanine amidase AmpD